MKPLDLCGLSKNTYTGVIIVIQLFSFQRLFYIETEGGQWFLSPRTEFWPQNIPLAAMRLSFIKNHVDALSGFPKPAK